MVSANRFRRRLEIPLRENLGPFLVTEDVDMKGMASTSGPFFPTQGKDGLGAAGKGPHGDTTAPSSSRAGRTWPEGLKKEGNKTKSQRSKGRRVTQEQGWVFPRKEEGPGTRERQKEPMGQREERAARSHPALRTPGRTEWDTVLMAGDFQQNNYCQRKAGVREKMKGLPLNLPVFSKTFSSS